MSSPIDRGGQLMLVHSACLALAWISVAARLYTTARFHKRQQADDYLMYCSLLAYTVFASIAIHAVVDGGLGKHSQELSPDQLSIYYRAWYICEIIYGPQAALTRTSIALLLMRVFSPKLQPSKVLLKVCIGIVWASSIAHPFTVAFQCDPPAHYWQRAWGAQGSCRRQKLALNATIAHSAISAVCDWLLAAIPAVMVWQLQIPPRRKIIPICFLSLGVIAGVIMIVRIPKIHELGSSDDFVYDSIDVALWSLMEPAIGILAGCFATYGPAVKATQRWLRGPRDQANTGRVPSKYRQVLKTTEICVTSSKALGSLSPEDPYDVVFSGGRRNSGSQSSYDPGREAFF